MKYYHKSFLIFIFFLCSYSIQAQENNGCYPEWSTCIGIVPHFKDQIYDPTKPFSPFYFVQRPKYLFESYKLGIPELAGNVSYCLSHRWAFSSGISYLYTKNNLVYGIPYYLNDPTVVIYTTKTHIVEIPILAHFYFIDSRTVSFGISAGAVNSFALYSHIMPDERPDGSKVKTTIYQGYLQAGLNFEIKNIGKGSICFNPFFRIPLVDYFNRKNYDIGYYPNVFYQRMVGLGIGYKWALGNKEIKKIGPPK